MSGDRTFVDTNVLVYAYDMSAGAKRLKARKIVADLWESGLGVVSTQVLQEFFVTVTRKLPRDMDLSAARGIVSDLMKWDLVVIGEGVDEVGFSDRCSSPNRGLYALTFGGPFLRP